MFCISDLVLLLLLKVLLLSCAGCADTVVSLTANSSVTCPDDSVSYTCTVPGALLAWIIISPDGSDMLNRPILSTFLNQTFTVGEPVMYTAAVPEFSDGLLTSVLTTVTEVQALNGTTVICRFNLTEEDLAVITLATPPSIPLNTIAFPSCLGNLVTLQWDPPSDSGGAAVSYELTVSPTPLSGPPPSLTNTSIQLSLDYNTNYNVSITSNNCAGSCDSSIFSFSTNVTCDQSPSSSPGVTITPGSVPLPALVGSVFTFICTENNQMIASTCGGDGEWSPDPENYECPTLAPPVTCSSPGTPANGFVNTTGGSSYSEDSVVSYGCDPGLFPMGLLNATCTDVGGNGEWRDQDPGTVVCRTAPANCTVPDPPSNGNINYMGNVILNSTVVEGTVLTYQCDSGLVLTGTTGTIECGNDGRWSQDPLGIMCVDNTPVDSGVAVIAGSVAAVLIIVITATIIIVLIAVLLARQKRVKGKGSGPAGVVNPAPVYDEIDLVSTQSKSEPGIELQSNQAYGKLRR